MMQDYTPRGHAISEPFTMVVCYLLSILAILTNQGWNRYTILYWLFGHEALLDLAEARCILAIVSTFNEIRRRANHG